MQTMQFKLEFSEEADRQLSHLERTKSKKAVLRAVRKTLGLMETNLRHPSLNTHKYSSLVGPNGEEIFESYAQNKTPGAYRVFWFYGPQKSVITIVAMVSHP